MFGPWIEIYTWLKTVKPSFKFKRPSFNYITLHYMYLIFLTILGSVILYPVKNMNYMDALFFSAGAATQSGLNTINVNDLYLYQQVTLYLVCMVANPIFINTFLVFVRLYWFEKRFQSVVKESQRLRRTRTRDGRRTSTWGKGDGDPVLVEAGMAGKRITVVTPGPATIHDALEDTENGGKVDMSGHAVTRDRHGEDDDDETEDSSAGTSARGGEKSSQESSEPTGQPFRREITFADEVMPPRHTRTISFNDPRPAQISAEKNIEFLQRQRDLQKDKGVLYIPGPRDFDRGDKPHELDDEPQSPVTPRSRVPPRIGFAQRKDADNISTISDPSKIGRSNTFDKAVSTARSTWGSRFQYSKTDKTDVIDEEEDPMKRQGLRNRGRRSSLASFMTTSNDTHGPMPYLSYQPTIGRNSTFINLTEEQREELGGIEYRSLKTLAVILCTYFIGFHLLGMITLVPWMVRSGTWGPLAEENGFNRTWWGIFTAASAFNDLGFTLTPDSMLSFQYAIMPLLLMSFLIIIGNTGFPIMLRFVIWILSNVVPEGTGLYEELRFLLDHPRRCFTLLFPARATWWLFWVLVILNGTDLVFFIILDLKDSVITGLPGGIRVLDGLFQACSTRTAGFADVNLALLHPAIQVNYLVMMYISVLPIAISVRRTNVYEEKSLGIYGNEDEEDETGEKSNQSYVGAHLRRQLSFDLWYVFLGLFIVAIVEGTRLQSGDPNFSIFAILFEIVSAYGTVGLSLGYPTIDASLSTEFHVISKLIIVAMMLRGRHRGLPYALDKAILLPNEKNQGLQRKMEEEDAARRARRRNSWASRSATNDSVHRVTTNESGNSNSITEGGPPVRDFAVEADDRERERRRQVRNDNEKDEGIDEESALRAGPGPAAPGLRWLQSGGGTSSNEKGSFEDEDQDRASWTKKKAQGGFGRLVSQMLSAGPTVRKKLYEGATV